MNPTLETTRRAEAVERTAPRVIDSIHRSPGLHWVGNGFRVAGYFSAIPDAMRKLDPFLLLDYHPEYQYSPTERPRGVGVHPHRGFETVTMAFQGSVAHHDSAGGGGVIGPGDVQWMTAASGILHKEYHEENYARQGGPFQMAQLWVNLPRAHKMDAPRYQPIVSGDIPEVQLPDNGGKVRVVAGDFGGTRGPAKTFSPVRLLDAQLREGGTLEMSFPADETVAVLVMKGEVGIQDAEAGEHDFVIFARQGERILIEARSEARLLVMNGAPLREPIVAYGPFVMNTEQQIHEAISDMNGGRFGYLAD